MEEEFGRRVIFAAVAGSAGCAALYPIDLVKTRMQNQVTLRHAVPMYRSSRDCARQLLRGEGFFAFYKGLAPPLLAIAPEKAIGLTINDMMRKKLLHDRTHPSLLWEMLPGAVAGAAQVIITNPSDLIKIRLQIQGEALRNGSLVPKPLSGLQMARSLGLRSLYKGVGACLMRDIPFNVIYFTSYSRLKGLLAPRETTVAGIFLAGTLAGIPAAAIVTPADVIKTRIQARCDSLPVEGARLTATKIWRQEGLQAFFKGTWPRVCRSGPQLGVTLLVYEFLQTTFTSTHN